MDPNDDDLCPDDFCPDCGCGTNHHVSGTGIENFMFCQLCESHCMVDKEEPAR